MKISLIISVLNEEKSLELFLETLTAQTKKPDQIIFIDGGSKDKTVELINSWSKKLPLTIITKRGAGIAASRNLGIKRATGELIAVTDVCLLDKNWFQEITKPFSDSNVAVVGGFFRPAANSTFAKSLAALTIPTLSEINPETFLPSSRSVAFRKSAWHAVGGYPEWLPICEDLIFDIKLKKADFKFAFAPKAIAYWEPRPTLQKFFKQYYLYARGDGHAHLWIKRHTVRYATYLFLLASIVGIFLGAYWIAGLDLLGGLIYSSKLYHRFQIHFPDESWSKLALFFYIPALLFTGDLAKMVGFPVGLYERATKKIKYEKF